MSSQSVQAYKSAIYPPPQQNRGGSRNQSLDWISGIMILYIIIMHATMYYRVSWIIETAKILGAILFMYMPWFFFKAGMYAKFTPAYATIRSSYKRLLVPWIVFGLLGLAIISLIAIRQIGGIAHLPEWILEIIVIEMAMPGNPALWFLISLFACRLIASIIPITRMPWALITAVIGVSAGLIFYIFPVELWGKAMLFPNIFMGIFFYSFGYIFRTLQYDIRIAIIAVATLIILTLFDSHNVDMRTNGTLYYSPLSYSIYYPRALCGILIINYLINLLPSSYLQKSIVSYIGRNSMAFYVIHMPVMLLCKIVMLHFSTLTYSTQLLIMLSVVIVTLPVSDIMLRRYWPEALGLRRDRKRMTAPDELP